MHVTRFSLMHFSLFLAKQKFVKYLYIIVHLNYINKNGFLKGLAGNMQKCCFLIMDVHEDLIFCFSIFSKFL